MFLSRVLNVLMGLVVWKSILGIGKSKCISFEVGMCVFFDSEGLCVWRLVGEGLGRSRGYCVNFLGLWKGCGCFFE